MKDWDAFGDAITAVALGLMFAVLILEWGLS